MRKFYVTTALSVLSFITAFGQIKKGSTYFGPQFSLNSTLIEDGNIDSRQTGLFTTLYYGKANRDNQIVGAFVSFSGSVSKSGIPSFESKSTFSFGEAGMFLRRFKKIGKDLYLFGQGDAALNYGFGKDTPAAGGPIVKTNQYGVSASLSGGLSYKVGKSLFLDLNIPDILTISYSHFERDNSTEYKRNDFSLSAPIFTSSSLGGLGVGFRFIW